MRKIPICFATALILTLGLPTTTRAVETSAGTPLSPGHEERYVPLEHACPTFSWAPAETASAQRLVLFVVDPATGALADNPQLRCRAAGYGELLDPIGWKPVCSLATATPGCSVPSMARATRSGRSHYSSNRGGLRVPSRSSTPLGSSRAISRLRPDRLFAVDRLGGRSPRPE